MQPRHMLIAHTHTLRLMEHESISLVHAYASNLSPRPSPQTLTRANAYLELLTGAKRRPLLVNNVVALSCGVWSPIISHQSAKHLL